MVHDAKRTVQAAKAGGVALTDGLEEIRTQIILEKERMLTSAALPVALDTAEKRLDAWLAKVGGTEIFRTLADRMVSPSYREPPIADAVALAQAATLQPIRAAVGEALAARYKQAPGISQGDRDERMAAHERALIALEMAEESLIRMAERSGLDVLRRAAADPRAVLATDREIEKWV